MDSNPARPITEGSDCACGVGQGALRSLAEELRDVRLTLAAVLDTLEAGRVA